MPYLPVELAAGQVSSADAFSQATSRVLNWQTDVAGVNRVRPALVTYTTTGLESSPFVGLYRFRAYVVGVTADRKLWALPDASPTVWTALSDDADTDTFLDGAARPVFAEDASDLFIVGGGDIQKWTGAGLTARLGAGPQASFIANVGQRLIANDLTSPSRFYYSDVGDGSDGTWQALSFITAESRPDDIRAVYENTAELFLLGQSTIEVHALSADPLIPFQRVSTMNIGCGAPYSAVRFDNQFALLDERRRFVLTDGRGYEVISEAIERDLRGLTDVSDCWGYREDTDTFACLVWQFPTAERTFAYDYRTKKWGERAYYTAPFNGFWPVSSHVLKDNTNLVGLTTTAGLAELDTDTREDLDGTLVCERVTGWQDFGIASRKRSGGVRVVMRRGTATLGADDGQLEVAVADDGKGWSDFKTLTTGQPGDVFTTLDLFFGGVFHRRRYWVRYSGTDDMSLVAIHDNVRDLEAG